jgi:hypothetical protein
MRGEIVPLDLTHSLVLRVSTWGPCILCQSTQSEFIRIYEELSSKQMEHFPANLNHILRNKQLKTIYADGDDGIVRREYV